MPATFLEQTINIPYCYFVKGFEHFYFSAVTFMAVGGKYHFPALRSAVAISDTMSWMSLSSYLALYASDLLASWSHVVFPERWLHEVIKLLSYFGRMTLRRDSPECHLSWDLRNFVCFADREEHLLNSKLDFVLKVKMYSCIERKFMFNAYHVAFVAN